jgi:hypothetical protein
MPISFACPGCQKNYVVSDGLAGKGATCKACGGRMVVPGAVAVAASPVPAPASAARPKPPAADIYGLDDEPAPASLPPRASASWANRAEEPAPRRVTSKKKAKKSGGGFSLSGIGTGGIRAVIFIGLLIVGFLNRSALTPRSSVQEFFQRELTFLQQQATLLHEVTDVPSAKAAAPRLNELIINHAQLLESYIGKKALEKDIKDVENELAPLTKMSVDALLAEQERISKIPGVVEALDIKRAYTRLEIAESRLNQSAGQ